MLVTVLLGLSFLPHPVCLGQENPVGNQTTPLIDLEPKLSASGTLKNDEINESSGLAYAKIARHPGAFWTINDSGHEPKLYLIQPNGKSIGEVELEECRNRDWEAMCGFRWNEKNMLAIADVGDNSFNRKSYQILCIEEPAVARNKKSKAIPRIIDFTFEGKPLNCEATGYEELSKSFWFVEKVYTDLKTKTVPGIYALPVEKILSAELSNDDEKSRPTAKRIADFPVRNVTGMAFSPDNRRLVVRTYFMAYMFERKGEQTWEDVVKNEKPVNLPLPIQSQGEAICFTDDADTLLVTSEQARSTIWKIELRSETDNDTK
jgi:hypothetical protein